jgi:hypothetical protein
VFNQMFGFTTPASIRRSRFLVHRTLYAAGTGQMLRPLRDLKVSAIWRIIHALRSSSNRGTKMSIDKPRVRHNDLLSEELEGQHVIYDATNQTVHGLNSTLSWVWSHCDGSRTVDDLIAVMQGETGLDDARSLVTSGLKQLAEANLLEPESVDLNALRTEASVVSRRAAVAAGVSIAVPVLSSMLAPTPAAAKSTEKPKDDKKK